MCLVVYKWDLCRLIFLEVCLWLKLKPLFWIVQVIKLKTTHEFVESQAAKAVVGQTIY